MTMEIETEAEALEAVRKDGLSIRFVPSALLTKAVCVEAVRRSPRALPFVPDEFKTPAVCLYAVKGCGRFLKFVPGNRRTREICLEAVRNCPPGAGRRSGRPVDAGSAHGRRQRRRQRPEAHP